MASEATEGVGAPRESAEQAVLARVTALLAADPVCMGKVNNETVRTIAQIVAFPEPAPDSDVLAERAACLGVLSAAHDRLCALRQAQDEREEDDEGLGIEVLRLSEAMRSIGLGLHRVAGKTS